MECTARPFFLPERYIAAFVASITVPSGLALQAFLIFIIFSEF